MTNPIKFGTDGWRALIAEDFTFTNVRALALSIARYLKETGLASRGLVVGYDTRYASDRFAEALAEVVTAEGVPVQLADKFAATPALSYAIVSRGAGGAAIITSSHNPASWNGVKYKPEYAGSASPEVVARLEEPLDDILAAGPPARLPLADAEQQGLLTRFDPRGPYLARMAELVDLNRIKGAGLRIAVDSMYGAGQGYLTALLSGGSTRIVEMHAEHHPLFPGIGAPEPIPRNLGPFTALMRSRVAQEAVGGKRPVGGPVAGFIGVPTMRTMPGDARGRQAATAFDVGIATDGDADRLGVMDEHGEFVTQLQTFALLAYYLLEVRGERGAIVRALTTTRMVDRLGELYNVPVHETAVGFKFVGPKMLETDALLGGEESGGYAFRGHLPERDGIIAGLYFLDLVARTGKTPTQLLRALYDKVGEHHYDRTDVHLEEAQKAGIIASVSGGRPAEVGGYKVTGTSNLDGYLFNLEGGGWLLIRFSGTEPLMRIYTEVPDRARVPDVLEAGKRLAGVA
ncbi:MAG: phosphoglucomutase/phosphomannomutase family protein [Chloroflexi bacterium]|nr:phosphoglucomutase/phosphomannomutase family protein [Chloroflexota bacterium]